MQTNGMLVDGTQKIKLRLENSFKLIEKIFTTSLQKGFIQKKGDIYYRSGLNSDTPLYSFYDVEVDGDIIAFEYLFLRDGTLKKAFKSFDGYEWIKVKKGVEFILINGIWQQGVKSYVVNENNISIDGIFKLKILNTKNIHGEYSLKIDKQTINLFIPHRAKLYTCQIEQTRSIHKLNRQVDRIGLREFIQNFSGKNWFDGFKYGGISFGEPNKKDEMGKLWYIEKIDKKLEITSKNVGSWTIKKINGIEILYLDINHYDEIVIFANIDEYLYSGTVIKPYKILRNLYDEVTFSVIENVLASILSKEQIQTVNPISI